LLHPLPARQTWPLDEVPAALRRGGPGHLDYPRHAFDARNATLIYKENAVDY